MMRYSAETRRIAMRARAAGVELGWITANIGPSIRTIQMWAKQDGQPERPRVRLGTSTPDDRQKAVRLFRSGMLARDVADVYGVDQRTINKWDRWARSETT